MTTENSLVLCFGLLLMMLGGHPSHSQDKPTPAQIFYDDKILGAAQAEVLRMNFDGVKSLTDLLASCEDDLTQNDVIQHECNSAKVRFDIEFGSRGALDDVLFASGLIAMRLRSDDKLNKHDPDGWKMLERRVAINTRLRRAANARFEELRRTQQDLKH